MGTLKDDIALVKSLQCGEECYIAWSEEMGGKVYRDAGIYTLYDITGYGSYENKEGEYSYEQIEELVTLAHSWT
jgi:hypothetical protein